MCSIDNLWPPALRRNSLLAQVHQGSRSLSEAGSEGDNALSRIESRPPVPGLFVAIVIEEAFGRARLARSSVDLFAFLRAYQDAAQRLDVRPAFPDETMALFRQLETKFGE